MFFWGNLRQDDVLFLLTYKTICSHWIIYNSSTCGKQYAKLAWKKNLPTSSSTLKVGCMVSITVLKVCWTPWKGKDQIFRKIIFFIRTVVWNTWKDGKFNVCNTLYFQIFLCSTQTWQVDVRMTCKFVHCSMIQPAVLDKKIYSDMNFKI